MSAVKTLKSPQVADASKDSYRRGLIRANALEQCEATTNGSHLAK